MDARTTESLQKMLAQRVAGEAEDGSAGEVGGGAAGAASASDASGASGADGGRKAGSKDAGGDEPKSRRRLFGKR